VITPAEAVDRIYARFGAHNARALHAKGTLCKGTFTATPEAGRLTRAAHMQGEPVDVTVRFSNGAGDPYAADYEQDVRGMATKFYLPDGGRTDISAQTVPRFPVRAPDAFIDLVEAGRPGVGRAWRLPLFLAKHREALPALRANAPALRAPASYATVPYYAIHAFKWVDGGGGERWVRYRWVPEAGDERISSGDAKERGRDYLQEDVAARVEGDGVRFTLELTIAGDGDDPHDPVPAWPDEREKVTAGTLELTALETGRETGDDVLVFDPNRLTDGIEPSDDPILAFRSPAYSVSVERRT
jgi:catalase